jgi:electron transfer flavoprotein alpha subunit
MTIVFVPSHAADPGISLFWNLVAPIRDEDDRVEFWLPAPESRPITWSPVPDRVLCGEPAAPEDGLWDVRYTGICLRWLESLWEERRPGLIIFPSTIAGHELAVRLSARLGCGCFTGTRALLREGAQLVARKKVCSSNLDQDAEIRDLPAVLTITGRQAFSPKDCCIGGERKTPAIERRPAEPLTLPEWLLEYRQCGIFPANPLETAPLIFAAGQGLGSRAACDRLRRIAERFGAPLGFSRPAALNGWGETGGIIGQSGVRTGAECYVAVGVSGTAAFMAGIEPASTLIAVNTDKNAPIFRCADIGIITGAEEFMAALEG